MRSGDTARIASPVFPASRGVCYVRFWYNMYGSPTMGPINVSYLLFLKKEKSYVCFNTWFSYFHHKSEQQIIKLHSSRNSAYSSYAPGFTPIFLVRSVLIILLVFCVVLLCVFTFWVPCCDVRYDFRIKTMFSSFLPPVVYRRPHTLFTGYTLMVGMIH
jgi:hypothetical protein